MVERIPARVENPRSEWRLTAHDPIAITRFTGGTVPPRGDITVNRDEYQRLGKVLLSVFSATNPEGERETVIVAPSLSAQAINDLLYFAAPEKGFGLDAKDIINDWASLDEPREEKRKRAHSRMPGWKQFEESKEEISGVLSRSYDEWSQSIIVADEDDVIIPVLRWKTDAEGNSRILLEPPSDELKDAIEEKLPEQIKDKNRLNGGMGLLYLAAYSPQQTKWPSSDGYIYEDSDSLQFIGPTQVLAYAFREVAKVQADPPEKVSEDRDLQKSPLLTGLEQYARTGEVSVFEKPGISAEWAAVKARLALEPGPEAILDDLIENTSNLPKDPGLLLQVVTKLYDAQQAKGPNASGGKKNVTPGSGSDLYDIQFSDLSNKDQY